MPQVELAPDAASEGPLAVRPEVRASRIAGRRQSTAVADEVAGRPLQLKVETSL